MTPAFARLRAMGLDIPANPDLPAFAIAGGLTLVALAIGWLLGRRLAEPGTRLWQRIFGTHVGGVGERAGAVIRHGSAALLIAIVNASWPWPPLARLPLGIALAAAVSWLAVELLRGLGTARWLARAVGAVLVVALVAQALGGLDTLSHVLDSVGFAVGRRRVSLLTATTALLTLVALYAISRLGLRLFGNLIDSTSGLDPTQRVLGKKIIGIIVVIVAFFVGIDLLGIDLTALAIFSGAFGLAVGFGFQKTFGNLISGIILLMDRSIKPGDVIVVGENEGWVNKIGIRAVSVITRDGKEHLIPNEILMTTEVENWSYSNRNVRLHVPVRVAYDCDLALAQSLMMRAAIESARVLDEPKPNVWVTAFGENAIEHEILVWISDPEGGIGNVRSDVLNRLWGLFKQHHISVPYPQRVVHVQPGRDAFGSEPPVAPAQQSTVLDTAPPA